MDGSPKTGELSPDFADIAVFWQPPNLLLPELVRGLILAMEIRRRKSAEIFGYRIFDQNHPDCEGQFSNQDMNRNEAQSVDE